MDKYAVIGNPIAHSKSPIIHALFAKQTQQNLHYSAMLSSAESFENDLKIFFKTGKGLNVTVPFKLQAFEFADELSVSAQQAGAVNTLIKQSNGAVLGDNTDGVGLVNDLVNNLQLYVEGKSIIIIGAGGATQGVLFPLLTTQHPKEIKIANRTLEKAKELSVRFSKFGKVSAISMDDLAALKSADIIINASSAGLTGESAVLPKTLANCFCYDMVYGKALTPFLLAAKQNACEHFADGLGMLVEQAAESFYLWRGVRPDTKSVLEHLRANVL